MKANSRKLLLLLSAKVLEREGLSQQLAAQLVPAETTSGQRSLFYFLVNQGSIWRERHGGELRIGITSQGRRQLAASFPALSAQFDQQLEWQLIILKRAPAADPHFRTLGLMCDRYRLLKVARGVYAYPGQLPAALAVQLNSLYDQSHLARCSVKEWVYGLERPLIIKYYDVENLSAIYSSASTEIEQLLAVKLRKNSINDRYISTFCSILDRLASALHHDAGFIPYYFPKTPQAIHLVDQLGVLAAAM